MKMISNKAEYEAIMARVDELVEIVDDNTPSTDKNYVELDFLTDLIVTYEKEYYPIGKFLYSETFVSPSLYEQEFV
jgi:HTH-type transcriptional regulator/antitoxin HigA